MSAVELQHENQFCYISAVHTYYTPAIQLLQISRWEEGQVVMSLLCDSDN